MEIFSQNEALEWRQRLQVDHPQKNPRYPRNPRFKRGDEPRISRMGADIRK
jgi:hypothetical protein